MRHLDEKFVEKLLHGEYAKLWNYILSTSDLSVQIRENYINVYYQGGNILKIKPNSFDVDKMYFYTDGDLVRSTKLKRDAKTDSGAQEKLNELEQLRTELLAHLPKNPYAYFNSAKNIMYSWDRSLIGIASHLEKKEQQMIALANDEKTEYMVLDLEYAVSRNSEFSYQGHLDKHVPRFDIIAIHKGSLVVIELKKGLEATSGVSGIKPHIDCFNETIGRDENGVFIEEMRQLLKQKQILGLLDKNLFITDEKPKFVFAFADKPGEDQFEDFAKLCPKGYNEEILYVNNDFVLELRKMTKNYVVTKYQLQQENRQRYLLRNKSSVFDKAEGELFYIKSIGAWKPSTKIIRHSQSIKNLFRPIRQAALSYFELNDIEWWRQSEEHYFPNGHVLSSQIHCLNHLFAIRADHDAVLKVIQAILPEITEILPSPIDEQFCVMGKYPYLTPSYISFEFTCNNKLYLKERCNKRGANCTSVDVFVYAKDQESKHVLIPIEWKYTEHYEKADEEYKADEETVEKRYRHLAELPDSNLGGWKEAYNWDPAYELARQTLLMEQIIREQPFIAYRYEHILVCSNGNIEMRTDAEAFKKSLKESSKFHIVDPEQLLVPLQGNVNYSELLNYLSKRYW